MFEIPSGNGERLWPARFWVTPCAGRMVSREHGAWNTREARADHIKLATHRRRLARAGEGKLGLKKIYAVGLEMLCPGGAYAWAPEIPSADTLAGSVPSKC